MRGDDRGQGSMFSYRSLEDRIPAEHPLRPMRAMVDAALEEVSPLFADLYARMGRPSIPPERLLRALLLQILFSIRSERQLMEELEYNLLYRWFVGLGMDDGVWVPTTFTKNRDRLLEGEVARAFFDAVLGQAEEKRLLSSEHFSVDGTLIEAWASHKSFQPKRRGRPNSRKKRRDRNRGNGGPRNPTVNFRGQRRLNDTHESTTDPEARLMRMKGKESKLSYQGHVLMENRHGLVVDARLTQADGFAEREAALAMLEALPEGPRVTLGADRGYDTEDFVQACRALGVTPHVAQNTTKRSSRIGWSDHASPGLRGEPEAAQTDRGGLRLDEDGGAAAQDPPPRETQGGVGVHVHRGGLQPGADAEPLCRVRPRSEGVRGRAGWGSRAQFGGA